MKRFILIVYAAIGIGFSVFPPEIECDLDNCPEYLDVLTTGFYEEVVLNRGESHPLDLEHFFSDGPHRFLIEFQVGDDDVIAVSPDGIVVGVGVGVTTLKAYVSNDVNSQTIELGRYYVIDPQGVDMIPVNSYDQLEAYVQANPAGAYFLNSDFYMSEHEVPLDTPLPSFSGILTNPFHHVIHDLSMECDGQCGLFNSLYIALIDGLIFENATVRGSGGILANSIQYSYIRNVRIEGDVMTIPSESGSMMAGGFAGSFFQSVIERSIFTGTVSGVASAGGIAGRANFVLANPVPFDFYLSHAVRDCVVIASISNSVSGEGQLGGFFGYVQYESFSIRSSYFSGDFACDDCLSITLGGQPAYPSSEPTFIDVYTTYRFIVMPSGVESISIAELTAGTPLPGLEAFRFPAGNYPDFAD